MRMSYEYLFQLKLIKNYLVLIESSKYLTCVRYKVRYKIKKQNKYCCLFTPSYAAERAKYLTCVLHNTTFVFFVISGLCISSNCSAFSGNNCSIKGLSTLRQCHGILINQRQSTSM